MQERVRFATSLLLRPFVAALVVFAGLLFVSSAHAAQAPLVADAWTDTAARDQSHGADQVLQVGPRHSRVTLLRFDLTALQDMDITGATLTLNVKAVARAGAVRARLIKSGWAEATVTEKTRPQFGSPIIDTVEVVDSDVGKRVSFDVLYAVQEWQIHPEANFGIGLLTSDDSKADVQFSSRESASRDGQSREGALAPVLQLTIKQSASVTKARGNSLSARVGAEVVYATSPSSR